MKVLAGNWHWRPIQDRLVQTLFLQPRDDWTVTTDSISFHLEGDHGFRDLVEWFKVFGCIASLLET